MAFNLILISLLVLAIAMIAWLWFRFVHLHNQVEYMIAAVENDDFAFRYSTKGLLNTNRNINAKLNRVIEILEQMADKQRQRDQYFEILMECVDTGIVVVNPRGYVVESNAAACRLLHRPVITHIDQLQNIDKQRLSIDTTSVTLRGEQLQIIAINDISRQLNDKEQESWERITHVLTHEIMNSVTPITSLSETMLQSLSNGSNTLRQGLETISHTGRGLIDFVEHYRQYANVPKPNPSLFYVRPFLEQMQSLALHQSELSSEDYLTPTASIDISLSVKPNDMILHADENLISRVMINLLRNAIQAFDGHQEHPQITITARLAQNESIIIDVSNNGQMIEPEVEKQIFVPFFTTRPTGSGIGLPLSRRIMRASEGDLQLRSDRKHGITTFRLIFP